MRRNPILLARAATHAQAAYEDLAGAVTSAMTAGIVVDDEILACSATLRSWAAWLADLTAGKDDDA